MTSHRDCTHPATKAARARCRRRKAQDAADLAKFEADAQAYHEAYIAPYERQEAARKAWLELCATVPAGEEGMILSAEGNADDTSVEEGFAPNSLRWFEVATATLENNIDCNWNPFRD